MGGWPGVRVLILRLLAGSSVLSVPREGLVGPTVSEVMAVSHGSAFHWLSSSDSA